MKKTIKFLRQYQDETTVQKSEIFYANILVEVKEKIHSHKHRKQNFFVKRFSYAIVSALVLAVPLFILLSGNPQINSEKFTSVEVAENIKISLPEAQSLYAQNHHLVSLARTGSEDAKTELFLAIKNSLNEYQEVVPSKPQRNIEQISNKRNHSSLPSNTRLSKNQLNSKALLYTEFLVEGLPDF